MWVSVSQSGVVAVRATTQGPGCIQMRAWRHWEVSGDVVAMTIRERAVLMRVARCSASPVSPSEVAKLEVTSPGMTM